MGAQGEELLVSIKSMRNFLGDISKLLRTADVHMGELSWESLWGSGSLGEMSYSVAAGHLWMPREAARAYRNKESYPDVLAMVAVLLDDFQQEYKLTEPIVSASYFVFPSGISEKKMVLEYWQSRWFGWCSCLPDGTLLYVDENNDDLYEQEFNWNYMGVFGRPLVEISNEKLLKDLLIDPLVKHINNYLEKEKS